MFYLSVRVLVTPFLHVLCSMPRNCKGTLLFLLARSGSRVMKDLLGQVRKMEKMGAWGSSV